MSAMPELTEAFGTDLPHEKLLIVKGPRSGLTISIAVHSTKLGQALGGCRLWSYDNWVEAVHDSLRLAEGMTYKNAAAGLRRGGGKTVIYLPRGTELDAERRRAVMLDLGDAIASLDGAYMTAEDVGTSADDMAIVAERTSDVCGLPSDKGGVGEPSDATAHGGKRTRPRGEHVVVAQPQRLGGDPGWRLAQQAKEGRAGDGLAGAGLADDAEALAELDGQADAANGLNQTVMLTEAHMQIVDFDERHWVVPRWRTRAPPKREEPAREVTAW